MKELIRSNLLEDQYNLARSENTEPVCEMYCDPGRGSHCNKYCTDRASNNSPEDESDILF